MARTRESRCTVFRHIAQLSYVDWPTYATTPLFELIPSRAGIGHSLVAEAWFNQDEHEPVESFVHAVPLEYVQFDAHDRYAGSTRYEMETLFRLFLLKELYGWDHETALVEYLTQYPDLCDRLGLESVPNQSTLWRSWHHRFTTDLQNTVETATRTILIKAQNAGVSVPREPDRQSRRYDNENTESDPDDQTVLEQAETVTEQVSRVAFPASHWTEVRAVRSTRTRIGISRPISDFARTLPSTKGLAVSSTNPIGSGHHSATPIGSTYAPSQYVQMLVS